MIKLKQVIHYKDTNSVEATWVSDSERSVEIPDPEWVCPMIDNMEGKMIPDLSVRAPLVESIETLEIVYKCHSYADVQMQMFRDDVSELGGDTSEYEDMITVVESGIVPTPEKSEDEIRAERKSLREYEVANIKVEVDGMLFDGDETSQTRMARTIVAMQSAGVSNITWTLADNTRADVTQAQLVQALLLSGQAQSDMWAI